MIGVHPMVLLALGILIYVSFITLLPRAIRELRKVRRGNGSKTSLAIILLVAYLGATICNEVWRAL